MQDILSLLQPTPEQQQAAMAEQLRRRQEQAAMMQEANSRANRFNTAAAVAQMANNKGLASAAEMMQKSAQSQYKPVSLGAAGFALPATGGFVASPMYEDQQNAQRDLRRDEAAARLLQAAQLQQERLAAQRDRDQQNATLRMTLAAMNGARNTDRAEREAERKQATFDKNVERYATTIDKAGIPEVMSALGGVRDMLLSTKPGQLSGYGRIQGMVPDALATDRMQQTRALMQDAANIILKSRSGAAVTGPEQQRFLRAVGSGVGMDEATLRTGWDNVMQTIAARSASLAAGFAPEVHQEFVSRGGQDFRNMKFEPVPGARSALPKSTAKNGVPMVPGRQRPLPTAEQLGLPPGTKIIGEAP